MYIVRWGYQPFQSIEVCWSLYPIYGEWFKPATTLRFNYYASFEHFESALPSLCQASCWSRKTSKKSELAPSNGESQAKKSEVVFSLAITASSLTWSSAVVGLSKWPTYLHWGTAYHHLAKFVNFLCTNVFKSPDKTPHATIFYKSPLPSKVDFLLESVRSPTILSSFVCCFCSEKERK